MAEQRPTVLIVDDSSEDRSTCRRYLEATYAIEEAAGGTQALALCRTLRPACLVLDYRLPDGDGLRWFARLQQIFEPLYTTKPGGTGLGLYIVPQIITAHGGQLAVESGEGPGTTVTIALPRPQG